MKNEHGSAIQQFIEAGAASRRRSTQVLDGMLFTKYLPEGVRSGAITRSVRVWMRPHVCAGGRYRFEEGEIEVDSIVPITLEQITPRLPANAARRRKQSA